MRKRIFHSPFANLQRRLTAAAPPAAAPDATPAASGSAQHASGSPRAATTSDDDLMRVAMAGVKRLPDDPRHPFEVLREATNAPPGPPAARRRLVPATSAPTFAVAPAVNGAGLEGRTKGVSDLQMRELRQGSHEIEDSVDLHGFGAAAAQARLEAFLDRARAASRRCVLVIHGRGLNSGPSGPVLRSMTHDVLAEQGRSGRLLAFAAAHGGHGGATVVLLRRGR